MNPDVRWIWCAGEAQPRNFYLHLRRTFVIDAPVRQARIALTADSRYILYVNGTRVTHGPARSDPRWQCLDEWDIAPHLHQGVNVIAVLVHHYGEWTFAYILGRGGFLADVAIELADGRPLHLPSDDTWRTHPADAWERNLPRMSVQLGFPEIFDARRDCREWSLPGFDDYAWARAVVLGPPGMEPWPNLVPRTIPAMREIPLLPERIVDMGTVGRPETGYYIELLRIIWSPSNGVAYLATFVWSPAAQLVQIHAGSQDALRICVNGTEVVTRCVVRDASPDQDIVECSLLHGWNTVVAKVVQGEGQWHFYFRIGGATGLIFSGTPLSDPSAADQTSPWRLIGPFPCRNVADGFATIFPPEQELLFERTYPGKGGTLVGWVSAGTTREPEIPSVVMSREPRMESDTAPIDNPGGLIVRESPARFLRASAEGTYAVLDFGREVTGYPVVAIAGAEGGEIIDIGYAEALETQSGELISPASSTIGIVNADRGGVHSADRYMCRRGSQEFRTFDKRTFRYLQIDVRNLTAPLLVGPVSLVLSTYPVEYRGTFTCSDELLTRIWEVGRWTVHLSMEDAFSDSPWRERAQWWGDVRIEALIAYYAFGDTLLVRQGLRHIAQSQNAEGLTMAVYPTGWSDGILPTYTLLWVISLWDYYEHSGDASLVRELFPAVTKALGYFERHLSTDDLVEHVPYWLFVDWAPVDTRGESAAVNALYYGTLRAASDLAIALAETAYAQHLGTLADRVCRGMHRVLRDSPLFRDARVDGEVTSETSEQANVWGIVFGVVDERGANDTLDALASPDRHIVRIASPYFSFYLLTALARAGRHEEAVGYIRKHWKVMLDWGATTWWETWEPKASLCHGWSSGPTWFLPARILGIRPGAPGWKEVIVEPHVADLTWAQGSVPTPFGDVVVGWTRAPAFRITIASPVPFRVLLAKECGTRFLASHADGTPVDTRSEQLAGMAAICSPVADVLVIDAKD